MDFDYDIDSYYINNRKIGIEIYIASVTNHFYTLADNVCQRGNFEDMMNTLSLVLDVFMKRRLL